jgi:hypothetical protein
LIIGAGLENARAGWEEMMNAAVMNDELKVGRLSFRIHHCRIHHLPSSCPSLLISLSNL